MLSRRVLTVFLIIWVVVVLVIVALEQSAKWYLNKLGSTYQSVMTEYLKSSGEIVTNQTIKFRAKLLGTVLADRFEYSSAFALVGTIFDPKVVVKNFELKERKFIAMTLGANDVETMKSIENKVVEVNSGMAPEIKNIVIKSVTYLKQDQSWLTNVEVYLK